MIRLAAIVALASLACVGGKTLDHNSMDSAEHWVRSIELSETRGEVGRPFSSTVTWRSNYLEDPEFDVKGLPVGITFDVAKRELKGVPKHPGFYTVTVALRKKAKRDRTHRPQSDERWWPADFQVEIYKPVE